MVVGFYNPYHRTLGGGEYYLFSMMRTYLLKGDTVFYYADNPHIVKEAELQFGINLSNVVLKPVIFEKNSLFNKLYESSQLDVLFWYSDGSIPLSAAKKNYLLFQFPVPWVAGQSISNRIKLSRFQKVIVNSEFTKQSIDTTFDVDSTVLYPSIDTTKYHAGKKEQLILTVGRFTQGMNMKRQDVLIDAFQQLYKKGLTSWKFVLVGGMMDEDASYVSKLKESIKEYPIEIKENCSREELLDLYSRASMYWHAAGYGSDMNTHPEHAEHFGISVVEAMASGAIPIVFNAGGPKEIVTDDSGMKWNTLDELLESTRNLADSKKREIFEKRALVRAKYFDTQTFDTYFKSII